MATRAEQSTRQKYVDILHYGTAKSALGIVLVASSSKGVAAILIGGDHLEVLRELESRFPHSNLTADQDGQAPFLQEVVNYIQEPRKDPELELDLRGTTFQKKVWRAVRRPPRQDDNLHSSSGSHRTSQSDPRCRQCLHGEPVCFRGALSSRVAYRPRPVVWPQAWERSDAPDGGT